jgi:hypothetical protein
MSLGQPTDFQKSIVNKAMALRGQIITSFGQVEFLLADFSVKAKVQLPYKVKNRILAAKTIVAEDAKFREYSSELTPLADQLAAYEDIRNFMAHGFLSIHTDLKNQHILEYRMYVRTTKDKFKLEIVQTTLDRLSVAERDITQYTQKIVTLFHRIYIERGLEKAD